MKSGASGAKVVDLEIHAANAVMDRGSSSAVLAVARWRSFYFVGLEAAVLEVRRWVSLTKAIHLTSKAKRSWRRVHLEQAGWAEAQTPR
jgi:hypothetical protein